MPKRIKKSLTLLIFLAIFAIFHIVSHSIWSMNMTPHDLLKPLSKIRDFYEEKSFSDNLSKIVWQKKTLEISQNDCYFKIFSFLANFLLEYFFIPAPSIIGTVMKIHLFELEWRLNQHNTPIDSDNI